jgi:chitosanase
MLVNDKQKTIIVQTVNVFECDSVVGNYCCCSVNDDGPHQTAMISYGRSQAIEFPSKAGQKSNLDVIVQNYVNAGGLYALALAPYLPKIGVYPLATDTTFINLLIQAGNDPKMHTIQDAFFDSEFFQPALQWANSLNFVLPLSLLIIYDSWIQSGEIFPFLRNRFPEMPPSLGGDEKTWDDQYVAARRSWLASSTNPKLPPTVYRMDTMLRLMQQGNWNLDMLPVVVQFPHSTVNVFGV